MKLGIGHTVLIAGITLLTTTVTGCGTSHTTNNSTSAFSTGSNQTGVRQTKVIQAVGAEGEYADVLKQIGGKYVSVTGIMSNPATDPHEYEADTKDAIAVGNATLIVQNGLGYDDFMDKLEAASPNPQRTVMNVANSLGYGPNTKNPHLWYQTNTMPRVAKFIAEQLEKQDPSQKQYFENNLTTFLGSLNAWKAELADLKSKFPNAGIAVTEPVANYLLEEAGLDVKTPWTFQEAIMNGTDPSPQDVQTQTDLFNQHKIKVFCYNEQVITNVTKMFLALAQKDHIPTVAVYETMPANHDYQSWMEAETKALYNALANGKSTETIS